MIKIEELNKYYNSKLVLSNITLEVNQGEVFCLLGKNGAGKTTLINCILDVIEFNSGRVLIFDQVSTELSLRDKMRIGIQLDGLPMIEELTGKQFLTLIGKIYNLNKDLLAGRIKDLCDYFFEDSADMDKGIRNYSTGMKKKIAFCAAVIHSPELLVLDEPFAGLDPFMADQMIDYMKRFILKNKAIIMSSHDLSYVKEIATHIGVIEDNKLVFNSTIYDFTSNGGIQMNQALMNILKAKKENLEKLTWI